MVRILATIKSQLLLTYLSVRCENVLVFVLNLPVEEFKQYVTRHVRDSLLRGRSLCRHSTLLLWERMLRDNTKNGCVGECAQKSIIKENVTCKHVTFSKILHS